MKKIFIGLMLICFPLYAQTTTGFSLLKMGIDVRAAGMSGAGITNAGDVGFSAENPAALAASDHLSAMLMVNDGLLDATQGYVALQLINGVHNIAVSASYLKFPGIEIRGEVPTANPAGISDAYNLALGVSYATKWQSWEIGARGKYLFEKYYLDSAPGWAMDIGIRRSALLPGIDFAAVLSNIGKMSRLQKTSTPLPSFIKAGFAYTVPGDIFNKELLLLPEVQWISDQPVISRIGLQYTFNGFLNLYSGISLEGSVFNWAAGFAVSYHSIQIHYAYAPFGYDLGSSNRLALMLDF